MRHYKLILQFIWQVLLRSGSCLAKWLPAEIHKPDKAWALIGGSGFVYSKVWTEQMVNISPQKKKPPPPKMGRDGVYQGQSGVLKLMFAFSSFEPLGFLS